MGNYEREWIKDKDKKKEELKLEQCRKKLQPKLTEWSCVWLDIWLILRWLIESFGGIEINDNIKSKKWRKRVQFWRLKILTLKVKSLNKNRAQGCAGGVRSARSGNGASFKCGVLSGESGDLSGLTSCGAWTVAHQF